MRAFKFSNFDPSKLRVEYTDDCGGIYSRDAAKSFGVRHRDVLGEVERLRKILPFKENLFTQCSYYSYSKKKECPEWLLSVTAFFLMISNPEEKDINAKLAYVRELINSQNLSIKTNVETLLNTYNKD